MYIEFKHKLHIYFTSKTVLCKSVIIFSIAQVFCVNTNGELRDFNSVLVTSSVSVRMVKRRAGNAARAANESAYRILFFGLARCGLFHATTLCLFS